MYSYWFTYVSNIVLNVRLRLVPFVQFKNAEYTASETKKKNFPRHFRMKLITWNYN